MKIEEFLIARVQGLLYYRDFYAPDSGVWEEITRLVFCVQDIIDWHKNWPILIETEPVYERVIDESRTNDVTYRMSKRMQWLTQKEYIKKFGSEPPTAPLLLKMAQRWKDHPDFNPDWAL